MSAASNDVIATPKLRPPRLFLLSLAAMGALSLVPSVRVMPGAWNWLGLIPLGSGIALAMAAARQFAAAGTGIVPFSPSTMLVDTGAFAISRNPMYLGMLLALCGVALVLDSLWPWLAPPVFFAVIRQRFVMREEIHMLATFGSRYDAYRRRVRRWL